MFVNFFIDRPVFSTVLALVILIAGAVCIPILPIAQFPEIAPPVVQISATYTGAGAEVVEQTVTNTIETQVNGVQGMTYITSQSSSDGSSSINATFDVGYPLDIAAVDTQNYESFATPQLPSDVVKYGVTVKKQAVDLTLVVNLLSPNGTYKDLFLSNYATINIIDRIKRIRGIGNVQIFGERRYSMRIWLDPDKLTSMGLTVTDIVNALQEQNLQVAAGSVGAPPLTQEVAFQYTIITKGRLDDPKEFEDIIIRTNSDGAVVRMKDVGRVELGAESYKWFSDFSAKDTASIGIYQLPGANSNDIADAVYKLMKEASKSFPKDMTYKIAYDTTQFVRESIREVLETLIEAIILVFLVIYIFLQNWRTTVIPAITIPVSLVGTFAIMLATGFSINTLTLFGLVLAIGLVVDDSIVVVENVTRILEEGKLSPKEATKKAMTEVVSPIIATTLVLMAVFVPVSLMPGITGQLYKQFALTIAFSVGLSAINALTLSPAMCAAILKSGGEIRTGFFGKFNEGFLKFTNSYEKIVRTLIKNWKRALAGFFALMLLTVWLVKAVPTGFLPDEDMGFFFMILVTPPGTSLERNEKTTKEVTSMVSKIPGVADDLTIGGMNLILGTFDSSVTSVIVILDPWDKRTTDDLSLNNIMQQAKLKTLNFPDAASITFSPPPIRGLSVAGGFQFELEDLMTGDINRFNQIAQDFIAEAKNYPELTTLSTSFKTNYPQFYIDLDRTKAKSLDVTITDIFKALQTYLGSLYVNDFNKFNHVYRVFVQAEEKSRLQKTDITRIYVKSSKGEMVPLSALVEIKEITGPQSIMHYNLYRAIELNGAASPGHSSGEAIEAMEEIAAKILPDGYGYEWTGVAYQEKQAGAVAPLIFALALIFVFLFLAAQYESWSMPVIIMLAVPLAIMGAMMAIGLRGIDDNIYCQIGLVMLIGLASKNAILIVEFAKQKHEAGMTAVQAAMEAARLRLRPILMTALAFILGVVPLVLAKGAGEASRHSLGTAVFGGMIVSTFLSIFIVPVFYVVVETIREEGFVASIAKLRNSVSHARHASKARQAGLKKK